ncbi:prolipoprotein diacylglyceryl transferase [Mycolicibacterium arenosum]|uniref:Outer membrane protein n=1 Tax=Mycolicibacterium arenosum TaxID=2952157 RepID=A0ABT1LV31_9MYCO|nr:hypothetical protein [Mycolicibacterium sp. CAU 1645]MCP9270759.1 hypothetical protein [Mycolicibacterium sp. CAU 1645]
MTEPGEQKRRTRHILKRSSLGESKVAAESASDETAETPVSLAKEPESAAIEETSEPIAEEPADQEPVAEEPVAEEPVAEEPGDEKPGDGAVDTADESVGDPAPEQRGGRVAKVFAFGVVPFLAVVVAVAVGWLAFVDIRSDQVAAARDQAVQAAKDSTITLLSYNPDSVEQQLTDARGLLTGEFKDSYTQLTTDVVIPGAKQQRISAVATTPRAASVSTETDHAVVLVFVNQTVVVGDSQPSATISSVRVTLEKVDGKWLISKFEPV